MKRLLILAAMVALMLTASVSPAAAGTLYYHPNSGNYWWCDYYGERYSCYAYEAGTWVRATGGMR